FRGMTALVSKAQVSARRHFFRRSGMGAAVFVWHKCNIINMLRYIIGINNPAMKKIPLLSVMSMLALTGAPLAGAAPTLFTFANAGDPLAATSGPGTLDYFDPNGTGWGPSDTQ